MANFWNGIIRHIRKNLYIQTTSKKQKPDFMHHKKEWVQLPYEGALYQSLGANTNWNASVDTILAFLFFLLKSAWHKAFRHFRKRD